MTWKQKDTLVTWIDNHTQITELHHGDCEGSDEETHYLTCLYTVIHPPENPAKRAFTNADEIRPAKPYLERNHDIVDETGILIATPAGPEEPRSGTWATIRYAKRTGKPVVIIYPDGTLEEIPCTPGSEQTLFS